jgi:hypothetical protein
VVTTEYTSKNPSRVTDSKMSEAGSAPRKNVADQLDDAVHVPVGITEEAEQFGDDRWRRGQVLHPVDIMVCFVHVVRQIRPGNRFGSDVDPVP